MSQKTENTEDEQDRAPEQKPEPSSGQDSPPNVDWRHLCAVSGLKRMGRHNS